MKFMNMPYDLAVNRHAEIYVAQGTNVSTLTDKEHAHSTVLIPEQ